MLPVLDIELIRGVFTPREPIDNFTLLSGRIHLFGKVIDATKSPGTHVVIYGERGVGKTSFSICIQSFLQHSHAGRDAPLLAPRVTCEAGDTFTTIWRRAFSQIDVISTDPGAGFLPTPRNVEHTLGSGIKGDLSPNDVASELGRIHDNCYCIIILDEFDILTKSETARSIASTLKIMSDHKIRVTVVLVGVADSVTKLVEGHESVTRSLVEVKMPRLDGQEMRDVIQRRLPIIKMKISPEALSQICLLSRGFPHYVHLIAQYAAIQATMSSRSEIVGNDVFVAVSNCINDAQHVFRRAYHEATTSPRKSTLLPQTLPACALAETDEFGWFSAGDVREPIEQILGRSYDVTKYVSRIASFCNSDRGRVLEMAGGRHRMRYRFRDPMMQPFVVMKGLATGMYHQEKFTGDANENKQTNPAQ